MATAKCPRCVNTINAAATRCQYCHADFNADEIAGLRKSAADRRLLLGICGGIGAIALIASVASQSGSRPADSAPTNALADTGSDAVAVNASTNQAEAEPEAAPPTPRSSWTYDRRRDELRGRDIVEARIRSSNSINLGFPYGETHLSIVVRQHPEYGRDVIFIADSGQIVCGVTGCRGSISFDGSAQRISLNDSADYNPAIVFAASAGPLIDKLKRAERTIVELPFYQNGNPQFTFDTAGLRWPPSESDAN